MTALPRILLVEDDPADARLVLAVFTEINLAGEMCVVTDGVLAMDFLHARSSFRQRPPGQPAVVLLDVKLPRIDGFEVLQAVRADPVLKLLPVVVLSSSREDRDLRRAYDLGANGYVVKSIDFNAYRQALYAIGHYWGVANQPPPGSLCPRKAA